MAATAQLTAWISPGLRPIADSLIALQLGILDDAVDALRRARDYELAEPSRVGAGDVSFRLDVPAEERLERHWAAAADLHPIHVIAEGLGVRRFGGTGQPRWRVILDPIDGTRPLAVSLRSAFSLAGVAPDLGPATTLRDLVLSVQVELPPPRQSLSSIMIAERGRGVVEGIWDGDRGELIGAPSEVRASRAQTIRGGFSSLVHFFPGTHRLVGALADDLYERVLGQADQGSALVYDDQWTCTGGQLWALASGRYRFAADLRGVLPGGGHGLTCHPYDLAGYLCAVEAGVIVTDATGAPLAYPLDTDTACSWIAFANSAIETEVSGPLQILIDGLTRRP